MSSSNFVSLTALIGAQCAHCNRRSVTLCQCPCKKAYYCDVGCQRSHWLEHKEICTKAQRHVNARLNRCASCGSLSNVLKICGCGTVYYCSLECQRKHYGVHRRVCTVASSKASAATLTGGTMLSAYGDGSPGVEGFISVGCQTDETCEKVLSVVQKTFAEEAAAKKKAFEERRKSMRPGTAMARAGAAKAAVRSASAFGFFGTDGFGVNQQQQDDNKVDESPAVENNNQQQIEKDDTSTTKDAGTGAVTFVSTPNARSDDNDDHDRNAKPLQRKGSSFAEPNEPERNLMAKMSSFREVN
jgi:hypothetical protein